MGGTASTVRPGAVPAGKTRICMIGYSISHNCLNAQQILVAITEAKKEEYESWWKWGGRLSKGWFRNPTTGLLPQVLGELSEADQAKFKGHTTAPFCWLEHPDGSKTGLGGRDDFAAWAAQELKDVPSVAALAIPEEPPKNKFKVLKVGFTAAMP